MYDEFDPEMMLDEEPLENAPTGEEKEEPEEEDEEKEEEAVDGEVL